MVAVLLIGQGAREHALAYKINESPRLSKLHLWPGHPGMAGLGQMWVDQEGQPLPLALKQSELTESNDSNGNGFTDYGPLIQKVLLEKIDLVVVGPETPLSQGLADQLLAAGIKVFGPQKLAARLETDKAFAKAIMAKAGIPTAAYQITHSEAETRDQALKMLQQTGGVVIKAAGLAAGKGVFVCKNQADIDQGLDLLFRSDMRSAAKRIVLEEILVGRECSYFVFLGPSSTSSLTSDTSLVTDHKTIPIGFAVDYKRLRDLDQGPNTGGMGCYTPVPWLPPEAGAQVHKLIVKPLLDTLDQHGIPYCGCLYVGIMWSDGPKVVEFNVRLGDPEAQALVLQDPRDWLELMLHCAGSPLQIQHSDSPATTNPSRFTVGVVMTSESYPYGKDRGVPGILPLSSFDKVRSSQVFAASVTTAPKGPSSLGSSVETGSGRVLTVMGQGTSFTDARLAAYQKVKEIKSLWPQGCFRSDIALDVSALRGET